MDIDTKLIPFKYGRRDKQTFEKVLCFILNEEYYENILSGMTELISTSSEKIYYCKLNKTAKLFVPFPSTISLEVPLMAFCLLG